MKFASSVCPHPTVYLEVDQSSIVERGTWISPKKMVENFTRAGINLRRMRNQGMYDLAPDAPVSAADKLQPVPYNPDILDSMQNAKEIFKRLKERREKAEADLRIAEKEAYDKLVAAVKAGAVPEPPSES